MTATMARKAGSMTTLMPLKPWTSAEQFRRDLTKNVSSIERGKLGTLTVKGKTVRLLSDEDFQEIYGLAREIERLRDGIEIIVAAAVCVQENNSDATVGVLTKAALALRTTSILPTRPSMDGSFVQHLPSDESSESDDSIDFANIRRPY